MGEVLTQELCVEFSRVFLFHSWHPHTKLFHSFYKEIESGPPPVSVKTKNFIFLSSSRDDSPDINGYFLAMCVG